MTFCPKYCHRVYGDTDGRRAAPFAISPSGTSRPFGRLGVLPAWRDFVDLPEHRTGRLADLKSVQLSVLMIRLSEFGTDGGPERVPGSYSAVAEDFFATCILLGPVWRPD